MTAERQEKANHEGSAVVPPGGALAGPADVRLEFAARTQIGKARPINQDQYLIARLGKAVNVLAAAAAPEQGWPILQREGYCFLVADGMGGGPAGEVASAFVVREALAHLLETAKWFFRLDDPDENVRLRLLRESLERADRQLIAEGEKDPRLAGMGTTLTAVSILGDEGFVVHVGDSRAYLLHEGKLEQLTHDHTVAAEMVRQGLIPPEEVRGHRLRHLLTNVIGGKLGVEGEVAKFRLADGDRLLLCTDGLHGPVPDDRILAILAGASSAEAACRDLVDAAVTLSGYDDVTAVVVVCSMPNPRP
ncbi:MAG TPA: protein phosphatase 2C domain-containing protein [Gemmataceae bacterium]|nr:protein phosphatase 2C domain-containing protein [Gemmataceae bacterium]